MLPGTPSEKVERGRSTTTYLVLRAKCGLNDTPIVGNVGPLYALDAGLGRADECSDEGIDLAFASERDVSPESASCLATDLSACMEEDDVVIGRLAVVVHTLDVHEVEVVYDEADFDGDSEEGGGGRLHADSEAGYGCGHCGGGRAEFLRAWDVGGPEGVRRHSRHRLTHSSFSLDVRLAEAACSLTTGRPPEL